MEIFESVIDEIALSGLEGCTYKELWHHLSNRKCPNPFSLALDQQAKCYIWSLLHETSSDIINFYVLKSPRRFEGDDLAFTYRLVNDSGIKGSCWEYDTRRDVTAAIFNDSDNRNLSQVITRYGEDKLVMVATQEVRIKALGSSLISLIHSINEVQYCVLEAVGRSRDKGILRTQLTNEYLKIDPRSTFHHVAVLQSIGTVIIKTYLKGHQLFLTRFSAYADQLENKITLTDKICNILLQSPNHCLPTKQIAKEFDNVKQFKRGKSSATSKGLVEVVKSKDNISFLKLIEPIKHTAATSNPLNREEMLDLDDTNEQKESNCTLPKHFIVGERLFDMQSYKVLDSAGPTGMTVAEYNQCIQGVDYYTKKVCLNSLSKQGCAVAILIDDDKVKKYRYFSNTQACKNSDINKLKSEGKKHSHAFPLAIRSKHASLIDQASTAPKTTVATTTTLSTASGSLEIATTSMSAACTSGDTASGSVGDEDVEVEGILKNASHDVEATSSTSTPTLTSADTHKRLEEKGVSLKKMERINFILEYIEREKVILSGVIMYKKMVEFETQRGFTTKMDRKTLKKLLLSLADKGMLKIKTITIPPSTKPNHSIYYHSSVTEDRLTEAVAEARDMYAVKEVDSKKKEKEKAKINKAAEENNDDVGTIEIPDTLKDLKDDAYVLIPVASKFQRLQHLHLYLWILQYGPPDNATLSSVTFPWISAVQKVDNIMDGVLRWRMITANMPLSLLIIVVGVHLQRMPKKLYEFIQQLDVRNIRLGQLPKHMQLYINDKKRDVVRIYELLQLLEDMKLVIVHQPTGQLVKINVSVQLLHSCDVLDTSSIKTRHSFFIEESRSKFNTITFQFDSVKDVQSYWFKLKSVCMMTKIYNPRGTVCEDEYALHFPNSKKLSRDKKYNKLGFGAGGLPPLMYSHILYNWGTMTFFKSEQELKYPTTTNKPILPEVSYTDLPVVAPDEPPSNTSIPYAGRAKRKLVTLEGSSATISAAKRVKRATTQKLQKKKVNLSTGGKEKSAKLRSTQLLTWSEEEDGVLMRCHVALSVLNAHSMRIPSPFEMREMIREWLDSNQSKKNGQVVQKHMNSICTRDSTACDKLKKCVDELLQAIEVGSGPPLNFKSLLHYLIDNYTGCVPALAVAATTPKTPPTISLPTTLQLLKSTCEVCAPCEAGLFLPPVHSVPDVRKSMLVDLIIAVMGAGPECYNEYTAFQLFEEYLEQELEDAIALLRSALLVKTRKLAGYEKSRKHFGPSSTQTLVLHTNFYSRLESSFAGSLFEDIYKYTSNLELASTETAPKQEEWTPAGEEVAVKLLALASSTFFYSSTMDTYVSNLASCDVELSYCYLVGKPCLSDVPQLEDEDDDCEDDDKENAGEETLGGITAIAACLPYYIAISLPDNRNFCDLTLRHGHSVGSLLAHDSISVAAPCPSDNGLTESQRMAVDPECKMDTESQRMGADPECNMDSVEQDEESSRKCVLDSTKARISHDKGDDTTAHYTEHNMECTLDSTGPTVRFSNVSHPQEHAKDTASHAKCDPQLSIDDYLQLCVKHLNYTECDVMLTKDLYSTIYHAGVMGVPQLYLEQLYEFGMPSRTCEHLQQLKNFEMIIEVGVEVVRLVVTEHKKTWLLPVQKENSAVGGQQFTKCRPWSSFHGEEFTGMCQKMQDAVLFYIMDYPGVTLHALERHFRGVMQLNSLRDILEVLMASGCISCHRMIRQRSCDLFSSSHAIVVPPSGLHDDFPSNIYFEPLVGCELVHSYCLQQSNNASI